jgi:hypothetical protein
MSASTPASVSGLDIGDGIIDDDLGSDDRKTRVLIAALKFLIALSVLYATVAILCIWEFTIGIKKSINRLFIGYK